MRIWIFLFGRPDEKDIRRSYQPIRCSMWTAWKHSGTQIISPILRAIITNLFFGQIMWPEEKLLLLVKKDLKFFLSYVFLRVMLWKSRFVNPRKIKCLLNIWLESSLSLGFLKSDCFLWVLPPNHPTHRHYNIVSKLLLHLYRHNCRFSIDQVLLLM